VLCRRDALSWEPSQITALHEAFRPPFDTVPLDALADVEAFSAKFFQRVMELPTTLFCGALRQLFAWLNATTTRVAVLNGIQTSVGATAPDLLLARLNVDCMHRSSLGGMPRHATMVPKTVSLLLRSGLGFLCSTLAAMQSLELALGSDHASSTSLVEALICASHSNVDVRALLKQELAAEESRSSRPFEKLLLACFQPFVNLPCSECETFCRTLIPSLQHLPMAVGNALDTHKTSSDSDTEHHLTCRSYVPLQALLAAAPSQWHASESTTHFGDETADPAEVDSAMAEEAEPSAETAETSPMQPQAGATMLCDIAPPPLHLPAGTGSAASCCPESSTHHVACVSLETFAPNAIAQAPRPTTADWLEHHGKFPGAPMAM
jgi:hypothetical protein